DVGVEMLGRLIERDPANRTYRVQRSEWLLQLGRPREASDDLVVGLAPGPNDRAGHLHAAQRYVRCGRWDKARDHQRRAAELDPEDDLIAFYLAPLLLAGEADARGYREHRERMLKRWGQTQDAGLAERIAKVCCLLEMTQEQAAAVLALALRG